MTARYQARLILFECYSPDSLLWHLIIDPYCYCSKRCLLLKKLQFCCWKLTLSSGVIMFPLSVVVSTEINKKFYFWNGSVRFLELSLLSVNNMIWPATYFQIRNIFVYSSTWVLNTTRSLNKCLFSFPWVLSFILFYPFFYFNILYN